MIHKVKGIVLHHAKYRESSAIVHMYTDQFGRQAYLIHSIRGKKSKYPPNILQSLTFLEIEAYHKEGRDLQKLRELTNYIPYRSIPWDLQKSAQAMFIAEVLFRVLREEEPNRGLFEFLESSLQLLDVSEENPANFHLLFLVQLTRFLGFFPENNYGEDAVAFDMRNGQFGDGTRTHPDFFDRKSSDLLHHLLGKSFSDMGQITVNQSVRSHFLENLMDYYRLHIQGFGTMKSLPVLQEIFSGEKEKSAG